MNAVHSRAYWARNRGTFSFSEVTEVLSPSESSEGNFRGAVLSPNFTHGWILRRSVVNRCPIRHGLASLSRHRRVSCAILSSRRFRVEFSVLLPT
jgi:hypothetical protein